MLVASGAETAGLGYGVDITTADRAEQQYAAELKLNRNELVAGEWVGTTVTITNYGGTASSAATEARLVFSRDGVLDDNDGNLIAPFAIRRSRVDG